MFFSLLSSLPPFAYPLLTSFCLFLLPEAPIYSLQLLHSHLSRRPLPLKSLLLLITILATISERLHSSTSSPHRTSTPFITVTTPKETISIRYEESKIHPAMPFSPLDFEDEPAPAVVRSGVHAMWMKEIQRAIAQQAKSKLLPRLFIHFCVVSCE
jgi:hypothetical protein